MNMDYEDAADALVEPLALDQEAESWSGLGNLPLETQAHFRDLLQVGSVVFLGCSRLRLA